VSACAAMRFGARPAARRRALFAGGMRAAVAAALLPLLAGCINEQREQQIGNRIAAEINSQVPMVDDAAVVTYVNQLGGMIARKSARPEVQYRFYVVDTDAVNAFALPGGHIYVNRGLIERTRNVSELSGVLAHEIGHVAARHGARNLQRQLRTGSMVSILYRLILGREPELLDQDALNLGGALWSAANSRADEEEADRLAVDYLVRTGVDPEGMVTFLNALLKEEAEQPGVQLAIPWFSTHPTTQSRITKTRSHIDEAEDGAARELARNNASYPAFLARIKALPRLVGPIPSLQPQ
jgi:predicted Zn-dependent protease